MAEIVPLRPRKPCPICKKPSTQKYHPFCSVRCANEDLNSWLGGKYAIPVVEDEDEDGQDHLA
jgi:endogenous inhibitor of DNA gyrase (YacG/DUF329 family)